MKLTSLHELFIHLLQDSLSAEQQLIEALPKLANASTNAELKQAFENHLAETRAHAEAIEELLAGFDSQPGRTPCAAMAGIIKEGKEFLDADGSGSVRDAALIAAAQRAEHYEISAYGTLAAMASLMGHASAVDTLTAILEQEETTDDLLSDLSDDINPTAMKADESMPDMKSRK